MANNLTGNPLVIDTAATITTYPTKVKFMRWTPTTTGDDLLVVDNAGNTIWTYKALAADANQGITFDLTLDGAVCNGIVVSTIDNGTLYIYL